MKIVLLKTWLINVGNGFIDKGARAALETAFPEATIIEASGYPNYVADHVTESDNPILSELLSDRSDARNRMVNVGEFTAPDLVVFPGCILNPEIFRRYEKTIRKLRREGAELLLLGAGGSSYDTQHVRTVQKYIEELEPFAITTRDSTALQKYDGTVPTIEGIDCGFYINDWYEPPTTDDEFDAYTFDKVAEPDVPDGRMVVRPTHTPFNYPFSDYSTVVGTRLSRRKKNGEDYFTKENTFVSDSIEDYLFMYANARETHSDRIHACVPALAYGRRAQFYFETPRAELFETAIGNIPSDEPVEIDESTLDEKKENHVSNIRDLVEDHTDLL